MRPRTAPVVVLLLVSLALPAASRSRLAAGAPTPRQKGISYAAWWPGEYSRPYSDQALAELRDTGADWISLIVTQYQDSFASTAIRATPATPTDADLIHAMARAHSLGLKVMLKPHVDLENDPAHWRGEIGQGFSEGQWASWFGSYANMINHYAALAQAHGVEQFCVGTELNATQGRVSQWRSLIAGVRAHFRGQLVYAANWGAETSLTWWDALDLIGVDAYYPLTNQNNPSIAELKAAWAPRVSMLRDLSTRVRKPVIFTEIGYRSQDGANRHPYDWQVTGAVDLQEQADAYQAALETFFDQSWFAGAFWWAWAVYPAYGGSCNDDYTPHDKPAEDVLRSWYGGGRRTIPRDPLPAEQPALIIYSDRLGEGWEDWSWDGSIDLAASNPVYRGSRAISARLAPSGALSLHHAAFDSGPYCWLEFYVYSSAAGQRLDVYVNDARDQELPYVRVCVEAGAWTLNRVRLGDMGAVQRLLRRVSIKNSSPETASFWVDELRFVGATWRVYLPALLRNR